MDKFPPVEALLPHCGTMLLLDRVIEFNDDLAAAEYAPRGVAWYADDAGNMPAWIGIELMAQTIAAHVALLKRREGLSPKMGALLGTRSYRSSSANFPVGRTLRIQAVVVLRDSSGLGAYECAIELDGEVLATAVLKVYEPEDFGLFVQGNME
ncbi:MAG: beta-hydroxyacyl-ACP dehydratase [Betaproteobacteria bacterium]